jgi:FlaA1/EpsC-like NDP-sugar epimerase
LLVIQASALSDGGDIFVLDMGKPIKILDIAKKMILIYGGNSDLPINFIGLRKGEKMHEKLFIGKNIHKTAHPKIFKAIEPSIPIDALNIFISRLQANIDSGNYEIAIKMLYEIITKQKE